MFLFQLRAWTKGKQKRSQISDDLVLDFVLDSEHQVIHGVMKLVYFLSRQKRCLAASLIVFSTQHITMRLIWVLTHYKQVGAKQRHGVWHCSRQNNFYLLKSISEKDLPAFFGQVFISKNWDSLCHLSHVSFVVQVCQAVSEDNCCFGTIDTWLLYKLTKGMFGTWSTAQMSS